MLDVQADLYIPIHRLRVDSLGTASETIFQGQPWSGSTWPTAVVTTVRMGYAGDPEGSGLWIYSRGSVVSAPVRADSRGELLIAVNCVR